LSAGSERILVDSSVWSLAFRRAGPSDHPVVRNLQVLLEDQQIIVLVGIVLLEVLQGFRDNQTFDRYERALQPFPLLDLSRSDYLAAASIRRRCRTKGVSVSTTDAVVAAAAIEHDCYLLSADEDFRLIARHTPLVLL
jgi:hypothetical protein